MKRALQVMGLLCLAGFLVGCSSSRYPDMGSVSGTVTMDGEPLPNAEVIFRSLEGKRGAIGQTDDSGSYHLMYSPTVDGAFAGQYQVTINKLIPSGEEATPANPYAGDSKREQVFAVDSVEVVASSNTHNFEIPPGGVKAGK